MPPTTSNRHETGQPRASDRSADTERPIREFPMNRRERVAATCAIEAGPASGYVDWAAVSPLVTGRLRREAGSSINAAGTGPGAATT